MPVDTKRVPGPESSQPYQNFLVDDKGGVGHGAKKVEYKPMLARNRRQDGKRKPKDLRPIYVKTGVVGQAKGSAYMEMGNTKVMAAIYGPREIVKRSDFSMNGILSCSFMSAPFSTTKRLGRMDDAEGKEFALLLKEALEPAVCLHQFQKAQVDIHVTVLENDGSSLAVAMTCASAALCDAGIPMYDVLIGTSLSQWDDDIFVDPTSFEEFSPSSPHTRDHSQHGNITIAYMPSLEQVAALFQEGHLSIEQVNSGIDILVNACLQTKPIVQNALLDALNRRVK